MGIIATVFLMALGVSVLAGAGLYWAQASGSASAQAFLDHLDAKYGKPLDMRRRAVRARAYPGYQRFYDREVRDDEVMEP